MKLIALLSMCVAGSMANMGMVSVTYGLNTPAVVTYGSPPPAAPVRQYSPPPPARAYATPVKAYDPPPPPPAAPVQTYTPPPPPPAAPVQTYTAPPPPPPAAPVQAYAPPPARTYSALVRTYTPPPPPPARTYSAPVQSYAPAPAPAAPVKAYAPAPAPAAPVQSYAPAYAPARAAPYGGAEPVVNIPITRYNHEMEEGKSHHISFETGHGIRHEEHTQIRQNPNAVPSAEDADAGKAMVTKTGSYSYTSPEGQLINLQYTADENGFHPTGDHLPVAPTLPTELVEAMRTFQTAYDLAVKAAAEAPAQQQRAYGYAPAAPAVY